MKIKARVMQRIAYTIAAVSLFAGIAYPAIKPQFAQAALMTNRSITMSDSGRSGSTITTGVGSGTNVTYQIGFTTTAAASSVIIDFCSDSPIVGDTCTAPVGMSTNAATLTGTSVGNITPAGWSVTASGAQIRVAQNTGTATTVGAQSFNIAGLTNPSSVVFNNASRPVGTFYARIYTFADNSFGSTTTAYASDVAPGDFVDYGGIALTTNNIISITARVLEQLTFCVSGSSHANWTDCSDANAAVAPALVLGHGSPTASLDSSATDTGSVYSQISTNATFGAIVAMRNSNTTCGGLSADAGATCAIAASNAGAATPAVITPGSAMFGMYVTNGTAGTGGLGTVLADTNYNDTDPTHYGMDTETVTDAGSVTGTYGDRVIYSTAPVYRINNTYTFAATAALTTPAGVYTANMDLIATGTF